MKKLRRSDIRQIPIKVREDFAKRVRIPIKGRGETYQHWRKRFHCWEDQLLKDLGRAVLGPTEHRAAVERRRQAPYLQLRNCDLDRQTGDAGGAEEDSK